MCGVITNYQPLTLKFTFVYFFIKLNGVIRPKPQQGTRPLTRLLCVVFITNYQPLTLKLIFHKIIIKKIKQNTSNIASVFNLPKQTKTNP